jgi:hypothetical protein
LQRQCRRSRGDLFLNVEEDLFMGALNDILMGPKDDPGAWGSWAGDGVENAETLKAEKLKVGMRTLAATAPVAVGISERVWRAHAEQVERLEMAAVEGEAEARVRFNPRLNVMELVASRGLEDLVRAFGGEVTVTLKF